MPRLFSVFGGKECTFLVGQAFEMGRIGKIFRREAMRKSGILER
jgi:hypothetical protein